MFNTVCQAQSLAWASCGHPEVKVPVLTELAFQGVSANTWVESRLLVSFWVGPREDGPQCPHHPFLPDQPVGWLEGLSDSQWSLLGRVDRGETGRENPVPGLAAVTLQCEAGVSEHGVRVFWVASCSCTWNRVQGCKSPFLHCCCLLAFGTASSIFSPFSAFPFPLGPGGLSGTGVAPSEPACGSRLYL